MALQAWAVVVATAIISLVVMDTASAAEADLPEDSAAGVVQQHIKANLGATHISTVGLGEEEFEEQAAAAFTKKFQRQGVAAPTLLTQLPIEHTANRFEIRRDVEACIRKAVKGMAAPAVHQALSQALQSGTAHKFSSAQLLQTARASIRGTANALQEKVDMSLVETAAKKEAMKVAKAHGKEAALAAAAQGKSAMGQAFAARNMASSVAVMFAEIAHSIGIRVAQDELTKQRNGAFNIAMQQVNSMAKTGTTKTKTAASKISATASAGVHQGVTQTRAVAEKEAKKAHLSKAQTKKLESEAPLAVKRAAHALPPATSTTASFGKSTSTRTSTAESANIKLQHRISLEKAADAAKEKAKKKVLRKYQYIAEKERQRVRRGLENAAKTQSKATVYVNTVAKNSLARGLDKKLSTQNLKLAAKKATHASAVVERAVKDAMRKAIREKKRLSKANEMVKKAGADAKKEAHRKNGRKRQQAWRLKKAREGASKKRTIELKEKKQRANEAAHKAISRVVEVAAKRASRRAARINAANVQKTYLAEACHRRTQHKLRLVAAQAKAQEKERGATASAQQKAATNALTSNKKLVVTDVVVGAVRRNAHVAAVAARRAAAARGMSGQMQLNAARRAWKAASPKIKSFCYPAATKAAQAEVANPGQKPKKINQRKFVTQCLTTTRDAVTVACKQATKPVVLDGAKKAALHDADYKWQVKMGMKEAKKACGACIQLYSRNAAVKCNEMVKRTFHEDAKSKEKSTKFMKELRSKTKGNVHEKEAKASRKTVERVKKKCDSQLKIASAHAKSVAARKTVHDAALHKANSVGKAASQRAYSAAIRDGLSVTHAKRLGKEAYSRAKVKALNQASTALIGLAPARKTSMLQLSSDDEPQHHAVDHIKSVLAQYRHNAHANKIQQRQALVQSIAEAVKALHKLGGELPSETRARKMQHDLRAAHVRIAHLEAAAKNHVSKPAHSTELHAHADTKAEYAGLVGNAVKHAMEVADKDS